VPHALKKSVSFREEPIDKCCGSVQSRQTRNDSMLAMKAGGQAAQQAEHLFSENGKDKRLRCANLSGNEHPKQHVTLLEEKCR
jgi:hypothetical protein